MLKKVFTLLFLSFLFSCGKDDPAAEVRAYCDCLESADGKEAVNSCNQQREEILKKYEFDPEASEIVAEELVKCGQ